MPLRSRRLPGRRTSKCQRIQNHTGSCRPADAVQGVDHVTYDEIGEIELANGETRRCKVVEVDGTNALVQL